MFQALINKRIILFPGEKANKGGKRTFDWNSVEKLGCMTDIAGDK